MPRTTTALRLPALAALAWASVATTAGCADADVPRAGPVSLPALPATAPDAPGPYAVGVTTFWVAAPGPTPRTLPVEVWYPALPEPGAAPTEYPLTLATLVLGAFPSPLGAVRDARADRRGAPHPTVLFSHGFGGVRFQSVFLTEFLASHGFVVAAPDHVGNTFTDVVAPANAPPAVVMAALRPVDIARTLDALVARSGDDDDTLAAMVDERRVGVAGHSFGGYTALRAAGATIDAAVLDDLCAGDPDNRFCEGRDEADLPRSALDPRLSAAVALAPGGAEVVGGGFADIGLPTMIQGGTLDETTPLDEEQTPVFAALHVPGALVVIEGAGHFTFSDLCELLEELAIHDEAFDDGCSAANIPSGAAHRIVDRYATAFLAKWVAGRDDVDAWLDAAAPLPDGVAAFSLK